MRPETEALHKEAEEALGSRNFERALELYQKILQKDPDEEQAYYGAVNICAIRGMVPQAVTHYLKLADMLEGKGQMEGAMAVCEEVIRLEPSNTQPRLKLVNLLEKQGNKERLIQESIALSRIFSVLGQGEQSVQFVERLRELDPGNIGLTLQLGETYIKQGQIHEGLSLYKSIAAQLLELKDYAKAIDVLKRIKVIKYNDMENLENLGEAYMELGKLDEAKGEFRQMLRQDLNHLGALAQIGLIAKFQGQWDEARVPFRKILELDPENAFAMEHFAEVVDVLGNHQEAVSCYLSAGRNYEGSNEIEKAVEVYQNVLALEEANPTARDRLAALGAPLIPKKRAKAALVPGIVKQITYSKNREKPAEFAPPSREEREAPVPAFKAEPPPARETAESPPEPVFKSKLQEVPLRETPPAEEGILRKATGKPILMHSREGSLAETPIQLRSAAPKEKEIPPAAEVTKPPILKAKAPPVPEREAGAKEVQAPLPEVEAPPAEVEVPLPKGKTTAPSLQKMAASLGMPELEGLLQQGQVGHAIQWCKEKLKNSPENQELKFLLGQLYYENSFLPEALGLFKELSRESQNPEVFALLSNIYLFTNQGEGWADSMVSWAKLEFNQGNVEGPLEAALRVLAWNSNHVLARKLLVALLKKKNLDSFALYHHRLLRETLEGVRAISELIPLYKEILEVKPAALSIREKLALCYQETGMVNEAKEEFLFLSTHYRAEGELGREADSMERVLALDPSDRTVMFRLKDVYALLGKKEASLGFELRLGDAELEKGNLDTALESYQRVLEEYPANEVAMGRTLEICLKQKKFGKAVETGQRLAAFYEKQNNFEKAIAVYKDLLNLDAENLVLHRGLADLHVKTGRNQVAIQEYMLLGHLATTQALFDEAIASYRQVIALDSAFKDARYQLGVVYWDHKNNLEGALVEFKKVRSLDSHHKAALSRLAKGYAILGDMEAALDYFRELLRLDKANAPLLEELTKETEARLQKEPDNQRVHFNAGLLYKESGKLDEAIHEFQTVIRKSPEITLRAYLYQGLCWEEKALQEKEETLYQTAVKVYKKGMEVKGYKEEEYLDLKHALARLYESLGKVQEALLLYQEIVAVDMEHKDSRDRKKRLEEEISSGKVTRLPSSRRQESGPS